MKKNLLIFSIFFGVGYSCTATAVSFQDKLEQLILEREPHAAIGLIVQNPQTKQILFARRSEENFNPASITKLFTAAAALKFLGPDYQFQTRLLFGLDKIRHGVLKDNLHVVFSGAPDLTPSDLFALLNNLKVQGIQQIEGNVIIDDTAFSGPFYAPGWTQDSVPWGYSAPISAIILNENRLHFQFNKSPSNDKVVITQTDRQIYPALYHAQVMALSKEDVSAPHCELHLNTKNNAMDLAGCWPLEKMPIILEFALDNPRELARATILTQLKQLSIVLKGNIIFGRVPDKIPAVFSQPSAPLAQLLKQVLAESNNVYAESLTKTLGYALFGQGSFQMGTKAIVAILQKEFNIDGAKWRFSDGSGQSRYNLVSPQVVAQLLNQFYDDPQFVTFKTGLAISGIEGTLKERLSGPLLGKVVGKTGGLSGVANLSGYFTAKNGKEYLFTLFVNQSLNSGSEMRNFVDEVAELLVAESWQ